MKTLKTVLLVVAIAAVTLAIGEWGARQVLHWAGYAPMVPAVLGQPDPELGWALAPNTRAVSHWGGVPVHYEINDAGMRDDATPVAKPPGVFRIVVVGDSVSFGPAVPIRMHYTWLLEGYFEKLEVINLAVSGYGVGQELLSLRLKGLRYQPDLVLAYVDHYANQRHMHATRWGKSKPQFDLRDGQLIQTHHPRGPQDGIAGQWDKLHRWLRGKLVLYQIVAEILQITFTDTPSNTAQDAADQKRLADPAFRNRMYRLGAEIVSAMNDDAQEAGAAFVLMTRINRLADSMAARDIPVLRVNAPLANPGLELEGDPHPNAAANGILAWELARYLRQNKLVPAPHVAAIE